MGSFRLRIILWTVTVSGLVLVAFGVIANVSIYQAKMGGVNHRLKAAALRNFPHPEHEGVWRRSERSLMDIGGRGTGELMGIFAYGHEAKLFYASEIFADEIDLAVYPTVEGILIESSIPEEGRPPPPRRGSEFGPEPDGVDREPRDRFRGRRGPRAELLGELQFVESRIGEFNWRFAILKFPGYNVAIGVDLGNLEEDMYTVRKSFLIALPISLVLLAVGAWFFASRAIKPVLSLTDTASRISAQKLGQRIESGGADKEFSDLIDVFNAMLVRLEGSFEQANRFSADAAHELKTPLAILQGHLELALQDAEDDSEMQRRLAMLLDEAQRLKTITQKLLILSQVDAGKLKPTLEETNLSELIEGMIEDYEMQTEVVEFVPVLGEVVASVDQSLFRQIVNNLLGNALKYNLPEGGVVRVLLEAGDGFVRFRVENTSEKIPDELRPMIFDRFSRGDPSRNRSVEGVGLGLSLAREFARAHGGELALLDDEAGFTRFELSLPFKD